MAEQTNGKLNGWRKVIMGVLGMVAVVILSALHSLPVEQALDAIKVIVVAFVAGNVGEHWNLGDLIKMIMVKKK